MLDTGSDAARGNGPVVRRYGMLELERAPESPGLYAWYVSLQIGPQDWRTRPEDGRDAATEGFLELLREYAGYYEPLPIELRGNAPYGGSWNGTLELDHGLSVRRSGHGLPLTDQDRAAEKDRKALSDTLDSQDGRRVLASLLEHSTPVFSAPLYIGVSDNIRQRLLKHRANYSTGVDWLTGNPDGADALKEKANSFGLRAAARGIAMENLEAWVIDLGDGGGSEMSTKILGETARSAEWLLHRIFSPVLGRQ